MVVLGDVFFYFVDLGGILVCLGGYLGVWFVIMFMVLLRVVVCCVGLCLLFNFGFVCGVFDLVVLIVVLFLLDLWFIVF